MRNLKFGFFIVAAMTASMVRPAFSADEQWIGTTGFWDEAVNWSTNPSLPDTTDDVLINISRPYDYPPQR